MKVCTELQQAALLPLQMAIVLCTLKAMQTHRGFLLAIFIHLHGFFVHLNDTLLRRGGGGGGADRSSNSHYNIYKALAHAHANTHTHTHIANDMCG